MTEDKFSAFTNVALSQGYKPEEVDAFVKMARVADQEKQMQADLDWQKQLEQRMQMQVQDKKVEDSLKTSESDPLSYVSENYGLGYLTGRDKDARSSQAAAIQKMGIDKYLQNMPLPEILSDKEVEKRDGATGLIIDLTKITDTIGGSGSIRNIQGVGTLGKFRPNFMTNQEGTTLRQTITAFTADRLKQISGAVITDREAARLAQALPQTGDTEKNIYTKAKTLKNGLEIGLEMQELAKRNRLTLDQAYQQFGADAFAKREEKVPSWLAKDSSLGSSPPELGKNKVGRFTIEEIK